MASRFGTWLPYLLTGISVAVMCALGVWQLERMVQKQQRLASIAQKQANGRLSLLEALSHTEPRDLEVNFQGVVDRSQVLLLDNQIHNKRIGFDVLAPVNTNAGWLLVNYGWVPAPDLTRSLPDVELEQQVAMYQGVVTIPGHNPFIQDSNEGNTAYPAVIQEISIDTLSQRLGYSLLPFVIQLTTEDPLFVRDYQPVVMSPEKHLGYAVQWFGLAIAAAAIGGFAISKKGRSND
ncbi:hypothetical protein D210916BOD24_31810 [Alteromonas sp. D210916BOD_24]|uniref:SURF1 family protein n=1 Tax=Alteromonas sp. D210916BOD_24 TaxID=3157618 RepID=UPI00399C586E